MEKEYFIKSIISLLIFAFLLFIYLNINLKSIELNYNLSKMTQKHLQYQEQLAEVKKEYNHLINKVTLEKKAKIEFDMKQPVATQIIWIKK